jgi:hypothetical protein
MCGDFLRPLAPLQHPGDMALNTFCPISFTRAALPEQLYRITIYPMTFSPKTTPSGL